jgi:cysteine desulfurase
VAVYLDHNATSPATPEHLAKLFALLQNVSANPSSPHAPGRGANVALTDCRKSIAQSLSCEPAEIVFVSGGSEANNLATAGVLRALSSDLSGLHAVTSAIEHPSVLEPLRFLESNAGLQLTILPVNSEGRIILSELVASIRENTALVSIMVANNETGAVQPMKDFAEWLHQARWSKIKPGLNWRENSVHHWPEWAHGLAPEINQAHLQNLHLHVDAVQAYGKLPSELWNSVGFDSVSLCAHKLGGVPGVGVLLLRRGRKFEPLIRGGAQERSRRAGTENLPGILSFGIVAQAVSQPEWWQDYGRQLKRLERLREVFRSFEGVKINSPETNCLPNTFNVSVDLPHLKGEDVLMELDLRGFYLSSGSACSSGVNRPSHVLLALGRSVREASNGLRFSLSAATTDQELDHLCQALSDIFLKR